MNKNPWKTIKPKTVFKNKWISVSEDRVIKPNGEKGTYTVVHTHPSVFIVAVNPRDQIYLIRQWRYPTGVNSWELPGGSTDGKNPLAAAKKELWEETNLKAKKWKKLGTFQNLNGLSSEISHAFLAADTYPAQHPKESDDHIHTVRPIEKNKIFDMIKAGGITDSQTISSLFLAKLKMGWKK
ncbi:MAG: NUDIX hydrolase [Patescibacteria group bacterium]|nr:NUDIX hydrolase [Patescibacteria group bacterium]